jgi:hypothetical protein
MFALRPSLLLVSSTLFFPGCHEGPGGDGGDGGDLDESGEAEGEGDGDGDGDGDRLDLGTPDVGGDDECAEIRVDTEPKVPTVVLLVDQSGSMEAGFSGQSRWEAVYETLMDPDDGVVKPLEHRISFGMALYTSENGFEGGECPLLTEVAPALQNHAALDALLDAAQPVDDTPTGDSLAAVAEQLALMDLDGPRAIVLATDGEPDTCEQPDPQQGQAESVAAAQAAFEAGVETYVISVGDEVSDAHLQQMANAGVGLAPQGPQEAEFYKAFDADELLDAFDAIIDGVVGCDYQIDGIVAPEVACEGTVRLDGQALDCGTEWTMADPSTLRLLGSACQILKDGQEHQLDATWPCGTIDVP